MPKKAPRIPVYLTELNQYREMFEWLRVEEECPNKDKHWYYNPIAPDYDKIEVPCSKCGYTGQHKSFDKLYRPLTMEERKELVKIAIDNWLSFFDDNKRTLPSGVKVVRK